MGFVDVDLFVFVEAEDLDIISGFTSLAQIRKGEEKVDFVINKKLKEALFCSFSTSLYAF